MKENLFVSIIFLNFEEVIDHFLHLTTKLSRQLFLPYVNFYTHWWADCRKLKPRSICRVLHRALAFSVSGWRGLGENLLPELKNRGSSLIVRVRQFLQKEMFTEYA